MRPPATTPLGRVADAVGWVVGVAAATAVVLLFTLDGASPTAPAQAAGAEIYAERCSSCHGDEGQGGSGSRLTTALTVVGPDPAAAVAVVSLGRNAMPGFADDLSAAEIGAVVEFVRTGLG